MSAPLPAIRLDVHAHLAPVVPDRLVGLAGVAWDSENRVMTVDGHTVGMKQLFQPEALMRWMDENNVKHAFVSVPPPLYRQHLRAEEARGWADYLNAGLDNIAKASAGRLSALMHLPTECPDQAAAIAGDWIGRGHALFAMPAGTGDSRTLADAEFERLWVVLDAAEAFVFFHPGECCDGRLKSFYLTNLLGNPYESTVALAHLVFGGVLERYRRLTPCFAHGGGLLPMVAGRFERGFATARPGVDTSRVSPAELLGRIHVDCICHSQAAAGHAEETFGEENVLFGSDWPFPMGLVEPHEQLADFSDQRLRNYFDGNPRRLLERLKKR